MVTVVVQKLRHPEWVDRLNGVEGLEIRMTQTPDELAKALIGADVLFGFDWRGQQLPQVWEAAANLKWIQWAGAGVDALLFPELVASPVTVTNAGGIYDEAIAEHVLAMMLAHAKGLPTSWRDQQSRQWQYRLTRRLAGTHAAIVGAGGIGRAIGDLLTRTGVTVSVYGTRGRDDDQFGRIEAWDDRSIGTADWLILAAPLTADTVNMIDGSVFDELPNAAVFVNIGRGRSVDEAALMEALVAGRIAGAALDVFAVEPLPADSALWGLENVTITPHHSGDVGDFAGAVVDLFLDNLARYQTDRPLRNVVDKSAGYRQAGS